MQILGKRGYAPMKFIRETKVLRSKLDHLVSTEEFYTENTTANITPDEVKKPVDNYSDNVNNLVQNESHETLAENKPSISADETINPHQISPSYESIYDETVIPQDIEPPPPSYSTQTLQEPVQEEEPVQLEVVPNLLSSTFSAISDIWNGADEDEDEEDEEENDEISSSEHSVKEEVTEKTPEIIKANEEEIIPKKLVSELENEEKPLLKSEDLSRESDKKLAPESEVQNVPSNEEPVLVTKVSELRDEEKPTLEPEVSESEVPISVGDEKATLEPEDLLLEINKQPVIESTTVSQVEKDEKLVQLSENDDAIEKVLSEPELKETASDNKTDIPKVTYENKIEQNGDVKTTVLSEDSSVESNINEKIGNILDDTSSTETTYVDNNIGLSSATGNEESLEVDQLQNEKLTTKDVQNDSVPNNHDTTLVDNSVEKDSFINAPVEEAILDKPEIVDTFVKSKNIEESINPEVPLENKVEGKSPESSIKNFLSHQESFQPTISENDSVPILDKTDISSEINESDTNKLVDDSLTFHKQIVVNNVTESSKNVIDRTSIPSYLQNDSAIESADNGFQPADSSQEHIVDIPSTPSFGEFLGNRNLLNAGKDFQYDGRYFLTLFIVIVFCI